MMRKSTTFADVVYGWSLRASALADVSLRLALESSAEGMFTNLFLGLQYAGYTVRHMYLIHAGGTFTNDVRIEGYPKADIIREVAWILQGISLLNGDTGVGDPTFTKFCEHHLWLIPNITVI